MQPVTSPFAVPRESLASLAGCRPAPADLRLLRAGLHSRRLVLLKSLLVQADRHAVPPPVRQSLERHWQLMAAAEARAPLAAREALAYPSVGNWLLHGLSLPLGEGEAFAAFLGDFGALAAAVALRTGTGFRMTLPSPGGRLVLPGLGAYQARAERVRVVAGPRSLRLTPARRSNATVLLKPYTRASGAGWQGLRPLSAGTGFPGTPGAGAVVDELDPYRAGTAPTGPVAPPITGSGSDADRARAWTARWHGALVLLGAADPARRAEVVALVRALVPLPRPPDGSGTSSGTLRSAPLAVLTELPGAAQEMATVLVHEVQHSKLALLSDLVPLHHADGAAVHRVPWRADLRPFDAVLQGTYAHLALADLWHRLADRAGATPAARSLARSRSEHYREQVAGAIAQLRSSGELSRAGRCFTEGMARHTTSLRRRPAPNRAAHRNRVTVR